MTNITVLKSEDTVIRLYQIDMINGLQTTKGRNEKCQYLKLKHQPQESERKMKENKAPNNNNPSSKQPHKPKASKKCSYKRTT